LGAARSGPTPTSASVPASAETRRIVLDLVAQHRLPLKTISVEQVAADPDFGRLTRVYYTAPQRVDFRAFAVALARALACRIDLRQISDREAAARLGGVGLCGQRLCCATWLTCPKPVPAALIRGLPAAHEPERLAGCCGRLMCCLWYEEPADGESAKPCPCRNGKTKSGSAGEAPYDVREEPNEAGPTGSGKTAGGNRPGLGLASEAAGQNGQLATSDSRHKDNNHA
jgi:cell fate regulator YaaT (PSP1 superfamily)